jgi:hypothetical protein
MSVEEHSKPHSGAVTDTNQKQPPATVDDGSLAGEAKKSRNSRKKPEPNKPDPEEVQYPGYFKDGGSL